MVVKLGDKQIEAAGEQLTKSLDTLSSSLELDADSKSKELGFLVEHNKKEQRLNASVEVSLAEIERFIFESGLEKYPEQTPSEDIAEDIKDYLRAHKEYFEINAYLIHVNPKNYSVFGRDTETGEVTERYTNPKIETLTTVAALGLDIGTLTEEQLDLISSNLSWQWEIILNSDLERAKLHRDALDSVEQLYYKPFVDKFSQISERLVVEVDSAKAIQTSDEFFELVELLQRGFNRIPAGVAKETYPMLRKVILDSQNFEPSLRAHFIDSLSEHSHYLYRYYGGEIQRDPSFASIDDWENLHASFLGLLPAEIERIKTTNWSKTVQLLNEIREGAHGKMLTVEMLRELNEASLKGLLPDFTLGFRFDADTRNHYFYFGQQISRNTIERVEKGSRTIVGETTDPEILEATMNDLVMRTNDLVQMHQLKAIFEIELAKLAAEYAVDHPQTDGNGRMTCVYMEACMALRGDYEVNNKYSTNFRSHVWNTLRGNAIAVAVLFAKYRLLEAKVVHR